MGLTQYIGTLNHVALGTSVPFSHLHLLMTHGSPPFLTLEGAGQSRTALQILLPWQTSPKMLIAAFGFILKQPDRATLFIPLGRFPPLPRAHFQCWHCRLI